MKQILNNPIYLGHLVQMRTTNLSYKNKKVVKRGPEDMIWVYNTHAAIVSQELWDKCREMESSVSQGNKDRTGFVNPLSGLVYCADCGTKMHIKYNNKRHSRKGPRIYYRENFTCGAYSKFGQRACSSHYIQLKVMTKIALEDIRSKMQTVKLEEKRAREEFLKRNGEISSRERKNDQKRLNQAKRRLSELDKLIASVYEDKVTGRILEEVCFGLLDKYQGEENFLKDELSVLERKASDNAREQADVDEFIHRLKLYMELPELTRGMCMELIEFITVDECPGKYSKQLRKIHIYYKLIDKSASKEQFRAWENNK